MSTVYFVDGKVWSVKDPNMITEAIVGVCIYGEGMKGSVLYPWHKIDHIERE